LGSLTLEGPSGPLSGRVIQRKRLALLALLAASRDQVLSRDKLVGYLWPESDKERARHNLSGTLHILNKELGDGVVLALGEMLRLNPEVVWTDLRELEEALERGEPGAAAELYRGPFLDGVHLGEALEFERWVDGERERYAGLYARALKTLALQAEDAGDYGEAAKWWKRLARQDPYDSRLAVRVIEALAAAGDVANALQHVRAHQLLLREELEVEPSPVVLAAAERLREESAARPVAERALRPIEAQLAEPLEEPVKRASYRLALGRWALVWGALIAVVVGAIAVFESWPAFREPAPERPSVAVLPFNNMSADPENEFFTDGMHDEIITHLSRIAGLKVISRTSVLEYKDRSENLRAIAEQLGVTNIVEGTVRRANGRVRITTQLIDALTDEHLWTEVYERNLGDVFAVQSDVAEQVAAALRAELTTAERERIEEIPTDNLEAYEFYLRGMEYYRRPNWVAENWRSAQRMWEQAVDLDPSFALAHAWLSILHSRIYWWRYDFTEERLRLARAAADRALELDPDLPQGHLALGYHFYWGFRAYDQALEELALAERGLPGDAELAAARGYIYRRQGKWEEAVASLERAAALDPRNATRFVELGYTHSFLRRYDEAERIYDRALAVEPEFESAVYYRAQNRVQRDGDLEPMRAYVSAYPDAHPSRRRLELDLLSRNYPAALAALSQVGDEILVDREAYDTKSLYSGLVHSYAGQTELARAAFDSARVILEAAVAERPDHDVRRRSLGLVYAGLGMREAAVQEGQMAVDLMPMSKDAYDAPYHLRGLAHIHTMVGDYEVAIDLLDYLLSIPSFDLSRIFDSTPCGTLSATTRASRRCCWTSTSSRTVDKM
jgi:TolB-like protein/DNA-binding SARP family transcriptional activator